MLYFIFIYLVIPFYWLFRLPKVYGRKNARVKGGAIVICNHVSNADPFRLALTMPRVMHFMAKKELFENAFMNMIMRGLMAFPVDREAVDKSSLDRAVELIHDGHVFGIFPEGTRSVTRNIDKLEKGAAFIAVQAKCPVIPTYIPYESYGLFKRPRVFIGNVIDVEKECEGLSPIKQVRHINELMDAALHALKAESEAELTCVL